jgi:hypothetical protein
MRKIILILLVLTSSSMFASKEELIKLPESALTHGSTKEPYVSVGIGRIGCGVRTSDYEKNIAWDHSISTMPPIWAFGAVSLSYKYTKLDYVTDTFPRKYKGISYGVDLLYHDGEFLPLPKMSYVYGRQYGTGKNAKWGQVEFHPLGVVIGVAGGAIFGALSRSKVPPPLLVAGGAALGAVAVIEATWGF